MVAIGNGHSGMISSIFVLKKQFVDSEVQCLFFQLVRKYGCLNGLPNLNLTLLFQGQSAVVAILSKVQNCMSDWYVNYIIKLKVCQLAVARAS